jgi:hypothetical protein
MHECMPALSSNDEDLDNEMKMPESKLNINAKEFKPKGKKRPKNLFQVSYHPNNKDLKEINCVNDQSSGIFTNDNASTCFDGMSNNQSTLLLTVRNSTKSNVTFDMESEDTFMNVEFSKNSSASKSQGLSKIEQFRLKRQEAEQSGAHFAQNVNTTHNNMKEKEFTEIIKEYNSEFLEKVRTTACRDPIEGHEITKEYRTKMADWMIEVTTSFKCSTRTYFLALNIFDKYLIASHHNGVVLANKDVHSVGVISMYLASKFEDVFPLHSKIVSEKIAHGTMTPK